MLLQDKRKCPKTKIAAYTLIVTFLAFAWSTVLRSAVAASWVHPMDTAVSTTLVRRIRRAFNCLTCWTGDVCSFVTLFADDDVELYDFAISNAAHGLSRVVFNNSWLQVILIYIRNIKIRSIGIRNIKITDILRIKCHN